MPDVVVKLDGDISFAPEHFERLLAAFAADSQARDRQRLLHRARGRRRGSAATTPATASGARRAAYRREILEHVLPLEPSMGWDGIDELKVHVRG